MRIIQTGLIGSTNASQRAEIILAILSNINDKSNIIHQLPFYPNYSILVDLEKKKPQRLHTLQLELVYALLG